MVASRGGRLRAPTRREVCRSHARGRFPTGGHRPVAELFGAPRTVRLLERVVGGLGSRACSRVVSRCRSLQAASGPSRGSRFGGELTEGLAKSLSRLRAKGRRTTGRARRFAARARKGPPGDPRIERSCGWKAPWLVESDERFTPSSKEASSAEPSAKVLARTFTTGRRRRCRRYGAEARQRSTEAGAETLSPPPRRDAVKRALHRGSTEGPRPSEDGTGATRDVGVRL